LNEEASMIFDIHAHIGATKFADKFITAETILGMMDNSGIDKAILLPTISTGRVMPSSIMEKEVQKAPERLVGFSLVNPKDPDAVKDFEDAVINHGAKGLKIHPVYMALAADDETWVYPLVEKAAQLKVPVMFHSGEPPFATPWQIGLVAQDFPLATIIMEHMGCDAMVYTDAAIKMAKRAENLILGTTGVVYDFPITKAVNSIGSDRVVFGSEMPMNNPAHEIQKIMCTKLTEKEKEKILGLNMLRILGMDHP
jgi:predicted TIM-barrel fold metal-dependent hydrolase